MVKKRKDKKTVLLVIAVLLIVIVVFFGVDQINGFASKKSKKANITAGEARGACRNAEPRCNSGLSCVGSRCIHVGGSGQTCRNAEPRCNSGLTCDRNGFCR